jgi:hypothetical protein
MTGPAYPAARTVAALARAHVARQIAEAEAHVSEPLATLPDVDALEATIDAAFWASLRREEGFTPKISLAFLAPDDAAWPLTFERRLPVSAVALARLAPAVERPGIHLGIWRDGDGLRVWGTTRMIPRFCLVIEVVAPGLLVLKYRRGEESGKFANVVVLEGDQIKLIDSRAGALPDCPSLVTSLLGIPAPASWDDSTDILVQLAVSVRAHGRGGLLLVVPTGTDGWRESIVRSVPYAVVPPFRELADLVRRRGAPRTDRGWQDALGRAVESVAGLTAVDGATVLSADYDVLAFGAKIARRRGSAQVEHVAASEPIEDSATTVVTATQLGGTRHLSAAQFVHDQRDTVALVASQDGRFTVFAWSPCDGLVRAHRVETLLL